MWEVLRNRNFSGFWISFVFFFHRFMEIWNGRDICFWIFFGLFLLRFCWKLKNKIKNDRRKKKKTEERTCGGAGSGTFWTSWKYSEIRSPSLGDPKSASSLLVFCCCLIEISGEESEPVEYKDVIGGPGGFDSGLRGDDSRIIIQVSLLWTPELRMTTANRLSEKIMFNWSHALMRHWLFLMV